MKYVCFRVSSSVFISLIVHLWFYFELSSTSYFYLVFDLCWSQSNLNWYSYNFLQEGSCLPLLLSLFGFSLTLFLILACFFKSKRTTIIKLKQEKRLELKCYLVDKFIKVRTRNQKLEYRNNKRIQKAIKLLAQSRWRAG